MLIGSRTGCRPARAAIQSPSLPRVPRGVHHRRGGGRPLGAASASGSALSRHTPSWPQTAYLYRVPSATLGHEQLPHAGAAQRAHREAAAVPVVEVAGHAHPAGVRRPHGERRPGHRAGLADVRAEHPPQLLVPAFPDQVQVELAEHGQEPVRVVGHRLVAVVRGVRGGDPVVRHLLVRQGDREHALVHVGHGHPAAVVEHQRTDVASGRSARIDEPSGPGWAPRIECGSWCWPATSRSISARLTSARVCPV